MDDARHAVAAWSDALNRHDVTALAGLYAERVQYYGRELPSAAVVSAKRAALGPASTFQQQIVGNVAIDAAGGDFVAAFVKRSGAAGNLHDVNAKLGLKWANGRLLIVEESDETTERRHDGSRREDCEAMVAGIVNELPQVKRELKSAEQEAEQSDGQARFGGIGPTESDDGSFSASVGVHTDESFQPRVSYEVDRAGHLSVVVGGEELRLPNATLSQVRRACAP